MGGWVDGGPSDFNVNQSPNLWIFGLKTFDLDFGLDKKKVIKIHCIFTFLQNIKCNLWKTNTFVEVTKF